MEVASITPMSAIQHSMTHMLNHVYALDGQCPNQEAKENMLGTTKVYRVTWNKHEKVKKIQEPICAIFIRYPREEQQRAVTALSTTLMKQVHRVLLHSLCQCRSHPNNVSLPGVLDVSLSDFQF